MSTLRERDAEWEPRCQFVKAFASTASVRRHPWPLTVALADAYHLLCKGLARDHPRTFVGPEWNHDALVYDADQDRCAEADRRVLLETGDALAAALDLHNATPQGRKRPCLPECVGCALLARWQEVTSHR